MQVLFSNFNKIFSINKISKKEGHILVSQRNCGIISEEGGVKGI